MTDRINSSLSLHQLLNDVNDAVRSAMPSTYWVRAEILQVRHSGYWAVELSSYEDGKKAKATAMIWASQSNMVKAFETSSGTRLAKGLKVLVRVDVGFHPEYGLRLTIQELDPAFSLGDMEARLNQIRQRLNERNEFALNKNLSAPRDFTRVAVISPREAAGLGDFQSQADTLARNGLCEFVYYPALFQGDKNERSIIDAMIQVIEQHKSQAFDCLVMIRGGGDKAGIYELNNMKIARGICRMPMPVLVGIGHDRDKTILDEVAHRFFPTPSLVISHIQSCVIDNAREAGKSSQLMQQRAAQLMEMARLGCQQENDRILRLAFDSIHVSRKHVTHAQHAITIAPGRVLQEIRQNLEGLKLGMRHSASNWLVNQRDHTSKDYRNLGFAARQAASQSRSELKQLKTDVNSASVSLANTALRNLERFKERLSFSALSLIQNARSSVEQKNSQVENLNPSNILARGFALVLSPKGAVITQTTQLSENSTVELQFRDGSAKAKVEKISHE